MVLFDKVIAVGAELIISLMTSSELSLPPPPQALKPNEKRTAVAIILGLVFNIRTSNNVSKRDKIMEAILQKHKQESISLVVLVKVLLTLKGLSYINNVILFTKNKQREGRGKMKK